MAARGPHALTLAIALSALAACGAPPPTIDLAETPILSGAGSTALAVDYYARVHERPAADSAITWHVRRGDILTVLARTPDLEWLEIDAGGEVGWLRRASVRLFASREQASNAARTLVRER